MGVTNYRKNSILKVENGIHSVIYFYLDEVRKRVFPGYANGVILFYMHYSCCWIIF